jgi:hypothetical protein
MTKENVKRYLISNDHDDQSQVKVTGKMINKYHEKIMTKTLKVTVHQRKRNIKRGAFKHEGKIILK